MKAIFERGLARPDVQGWGGATQALIYNPKTKKIIGINALGVAPTGATPEFYHEKGYNYPRAHGPLSAVTPGTPGGLMVMLAEFGTMPLSKVLAPANELADGYPIEAQTANSMESDSNKTKFKQWKYSAAVFLPHRGQPREAPSAVNQGAAASSDASRRRTRQAFSAPLRTAR